MSLTIVDTDILIDEGRGITVAADFLNRLESTSQLAISAVTQMEMTIGCRDKAGQRELSILLNRFQILSITAEVSDRAVGLLQQYNLSHGLLIADALIAATALVHAAPLASKNQRDFRFIDGLDLLPYPNGG